MSLQGSSKQGAVETSIQRLETHRKDQYSIYFYRATQIQQTLTLRTGTQSADEGGPFNSKHKPRSQRWSAEKVTYHPQRNPTQGFLAGQLYSRAKVPALTLPITGERQMEKHHRNREIFSFVGFGWSHSERQTFILSKIFVRTMLFVISFYLFIQTKIQSPHWKDSC